MGQDDQTRGLHLSNNFTYKLEEHKDNGMIRQEVCTQAISSHTRWKSTKTMGWDDQTRGLHSSNKFTYSLKEHKDNRM